MSNMKHNEWFNRITGGASGNAAATKAHLPVASLNRHIAAERLTAEEVIALSRAYGISPVEGLAATGHITHEEATGMTADSAAELLSDPDLIRTLAYRINADPQAWFGTFGELADENDDVVVPLHSNKDAGSVDAGSYDGTVKDFDWSQPHAADSSPDEQAEREKRGEEPID